MTGWGDGNLWGPGTGRAPTGVAYSNQMAVPATGLVTIESAKPVFQFQSPDGAPRVYGVQVNLQGADGVTAAGESERRFGVVRWGLGRLRSQAELDFVRNCFSVDVMADSLEVLVVNGTDPGVPANAVVAMAAVGMVPSRSHIDWTRSIFVQIPATPATVDVLIPAWARQVQVAPDTVTAGAGTVVLWQYLNGAGNSMGGGRYITGNAPAPFDLPNGARTMRVSTSAAVAVDCSFVFHLDI